MKHSIKMLTNIVAVISIVTTGWFAKVLYHRYQMPYNELGRYFEDGIVWHEQAIVAYIVLMVASFIVFILSISLSFYLRKKH
jgi:hypothetical protein